MNTVISIMVSEQVKKEWQRISDKMKAIGTSKGELFRLMIKAFQDKSDTKK